MKQRRRRRGRCAQVVFQNGGDLSINNCVELFIGRAGFRAFSGFVFAFVATVELPSKLFFRESSLTGLFVPNEFFLSFVSCMMA